MIISLKTTNAATPVPECHEMLVTCRKAKNASRDKTFPTNPHTTFIIASFSRDFQG
jgi:hypothetical protein